jgi:SNF2 family DNA or RNA helicase
MIIYYNAGKAYLTTDTRFKEAALDIFRKYGYSFKKDVNAWIGSFDFISDIINDYEWAIEDDTIIKNFDIVKHQDWLKSIKQLKIKRRKIDWNLLKLPPIIGKPPFENFQRDDITKGFCSNRHLWNWDLGLGKSYATAAVIENLIVQENLNKCLIFSTRIGTYNLANELIKFGKNITSNNILTVSSIDDLSDRDLFNETKYPQNIFIMPYDTLKSILGYYYDQEHATKRNPHPSLTTKYRKSPIDLTAWLNGKPAGIFMDESHQICNTSTLRYHCFEFIVPFFEYRYMFTGTPADKREKLYGQMKILDPFLIRGLNYTDWTRYYNNLGNRFSALAINPDDWKLDRCKDLDDILSREYVSKRLRKDCLDLPPNIEKTTNIDMSIKHRELYEAFANEAMLQAVKEENASNKIKMMFPFFLLSCENPDIIKDTENFSKFSFSLQSIVKHFNYTKDFRKLDVLDSIIEDEADDKGLKGIIWVAHPLTLNYLAKKYEKRKPFLLGSDVPLKERTTLVEEYKKSDNKLLIASIYVASTSLTITECKWECFFEKTFNYTDYYQSKGRIFRNGQTEETRSYSIVYNNSLDSFINANLTGKGRLIDSLFENQTISQQKLIEIFNYTSKEEYLE